jgi:hypothetical protein
MVAAAVELIDAEDDDVADPAGQIVAAAAAPLGSYL